MKIGSIRIFQSWSFKSRFNNGSVQRFLIAFCHLCWFLLKIFDPCPEHLPFLLQASNLMFGLLKLQIHIDPKNEIKLLHVSIVPVLHPLILIGKLIITFLDFFQLPLKSQICLIMRRTIQDFNTWSHHSIVRKVKRQLLFLESIWRDGHLRVKRLRKSK